MLDIKVSAALMGFTQSEQRKILDAVYGGDTVSTERLSEAVKVVTQIIEDHEEVVEGYAGFPIEKELIQKNKERFKDDRNIGRVISQGGQSMVITGLKSDGRYQVVGKKGEKTAKAPEDIGLNMQREHIDIDDLHQQMVEGLKQARKNVGASTCWDGYKAKGTKKKNGKEVPNCVKEEDQIDELYKGKHGQSEKEYQDSRSDGGKMVSGDSKRSGAAYSSRAVKNTGPNPAGGSKKPQGQGRMTSGARAELQYRKANMMKKEDVSLGKSLENSEIPEEMSPQEIQLQKKKATIDKMIAQRRKVELAKGNAPTKTMDEGKGDPCWDTHKQVGMKKKGNRMVPNCVPKNEEVELDERTRFAKETGKDFKTGNPSEKGGTRTGKSAFDKVSRDMRKTGGVMSSRGKPIQPQGKKKQPGKKGYKGVTPVDKIRNRLAQKRAAKPNPYRARAGESD